MIYGKKHIPDFLNWKNHSAFERAFARQKNLLRTSISQETTRGVSNFSKI